MNTLVSGLIHKPTVTMSLPVDYCANNEQSIRAWFSVRVPGDQHS